MGDTPITNLLQATTGHMVDYLNGLKTRSVFPSQDQIEALNGLDFDLPIGATDPTKVINLLHQLGSPGTVATAGGRYFGFVIGSTLPTALAAHCLSGAVNAAYLPTGTPGPYQFTPGMSRRARGVEAYAALYSLGKSGIARLIEECCRHARSMANELQQAGYKILNDVALNQVLVDFGERTDEIIQAIQEEGTCWASGTKWQGKSAMRISVSSWATTEEDVQVSLEAMIRIARQFP